MRSTSAVAALALACLVVPACSSHRARSGAVGVEVGVASWYGPRFHGRRTASGERYDMHAMTAAHRTLPFGTIVEVRNLDNGRIARVRINDRGPFKKRRILDLSFAAATALGVVGPGTARVEIAPVGVDPRGSLFAVQLGAFRERERAEALYDELCRRFDGVRIDADAVWFRVRIGGFGERDPAEDLRRELAELGYEAVVISTAEDAAGDS